MKNKLMVLLGLIALASPAMAQDEQPGKKRHRTIPTNSLDEQLEAKSPTSDEAEEDKSRYSTKGKSRITRGGGQIEKGGTTAVESDSAGAPLLDPVLIAPTTAPVVAPVFGGTPREGLREIERLARDGRGSEGSALAHVLIEELEQRSDSEWLKAELRYAAGVAESMIGNLEPAAAAFLSASAIAGPGELRLDALYNSAALHIERGELLFDEIPEVQAKDATQTGNVGNMDTTGPDTLPQSKQQFTMAREALISRLKIDWRDEDARANVEFVQRRLDEIERIESKREDATSDKKSESGQESEKTEEGEGSDKGEAENEEENDEAGDAGSNQQDDNTKETENSDPQEGEGAKDGAEQPNPDANPDKNGDVEQQEQQAEGEENEDLESEAGGQEADEEMSQEEVKMILDRLNEIDQLAKKLRAALYRTRSVPVERDW